MNAKLPKAPSEINTVGSRPLSMRPLIRNLGLSAMMIATVAGALHQADINPATMSQYRGETQQVTAQVTGKIFASDSTALPGGKDSGQSWQPSNEVASSSYNLVLSVPGEAEPVLLAVSPKVYDSYCKNVQAKDYKPLRRSFLSFDQFASCEGGSDMSAQITAGPEKMESVELTITRGQRDGKIQVERFQGVSKLATGVFAKRALMKETAAPRDIYRGGTMG